MFLQMTEETYMMVFFGVIILTIIFTIILILLVLRDKRRYKEEKSIVLEGLLTKTALVSSINTYLAKITPAVSFSCSILTLTITPTLSTLSETRTPPAPWRKSPIICRETCRKGCRWLIINRRSFLFS